MFSIYRRAIDTTQALKSTTLNIVYYSHAATFISVLIFIRFLTINVHLQRSIHYYQSIDLVYFRKV